LYFDVLVRHGPLTAKSEHQLFFHAVRSLTGQTQTTLQPLLFVPPTTLAISHYTSLFYSRLKTHLLRKSLSTFIKAKFHYASWFGAGSKLVRSWIELKFGLPSSLLAAN